MTEILTVPFRDEDSDLLKFLKERAGNPPKFAGVSIRDCLYEFKDAWELLHESEVER